MILMIVAAGIFLFCFGPLIIALWRGVNPGLIGALSVAANNKEKMALMAYAATAEPDHVRARREREEADFEREEAERSMERAFGNALDARLSKGYQGAPGYVPPSQRSSRYRPQPYTGRYRPSTRREPYLYLPK